MAGFLGPQFRMILITAANPLNRSLTSFAQRKGGGGSPLRVLLLRSIL